MEAPVGQPGGPAFADLSMRRPGRQTGCNPGAYYFGVYRSSSAARNSPSRGPLKRMAAMAGALTVSWKNGTGSPGDLRPGAATSNALSTTAPFLSRASSNAGQPVEPQSTSVTAEASAGNVACTGMTWSVAMAFRMPL